MYTNDMQHPLQHLFAMTSCAHWSKRCAWHWLTWYVHKWSAATSTASFCTDVMSIVSVSIATVYTTNIRLITHRSHNSTTTSMDLTLLLLIAISVQSVLLTEGHEVSTVYSGRPECGQRDGKALLQRGIKTVLAATSIRCARHCSRNGQCKSFNHNTMSGSCQLNWGVAGGNCKTLSDAPGYRYFEVS